MAQLRKLHLFNCDRTYKLDAVEDLLKAMKAKLRFADPVEKHYFKLAQMSEMSAKTIPKLEMDMAFFVVHAHESRLSINEDNAGIGYAKIYRALLEATEGKVIIIIGGDDNYKDEDEENRVVISRWARRKITSQFREEFLDGSKSFIFSWNKQHRDIHEEALLHYFGQSGKEGQKFEYQPKPKQPKGVQSAQTNQTREKSSSSRGSKDAEPKEESNKDSGNTEQSGIGSLLNDPRYNNQHSGSEKAPVQPEQRPLSTKTQEFAILCCNVSEDSTDAVMNVFHDIAAKLNLSANPVHENLSPDKIKEYLMNVHLKACVLVVDGRTVQDAYNNLPEKEKEYRELLDTAVKQVEKVIILIGDNFSLPSEDEKIARKTIEEKVIRTEKGLIVWLKNGKLSLDPGDLVQYLMITSPTRQPNIQTNYSRASQENNRDAPGSAADTCFTSSDQSQSYPLESNPSDWKKGHWNNAPNMQQPTPQAAAATQPYHPPAVNISGEPVLLRSLLRYGSISDHLKDRQLWDPTFTVPDHINQTLSQLYRDTPVTGVRIVQRTDGTLQWSVDPTLIEVSSSRDKGIEIANNETLMLKTRILYGQVSFQESDVHFRHGTWQIPQRMVDNLKKEYWATPSGDLYIISDGGEVLRMVVKVGKGMQVRSFLNKRRL